MTETPVSEMDFKLRLDLAGLCNNAADTLDRCGETGEAFDLREVARLVAELKAGKGTLAEFCDVLCLPMQPAAPAWNHDMTAAPRDGTLYRIKPLVWNRRTDDAGREQASAGVWGLSVQWIWNCYTWKYCVDEFYDEGTEDCDTLADGIAKAEAWYSDRVRQYLIPETLPPLPEETR